MTIEQQNRRIVVELNLLVAQNLLAPAQLAPLVARYPSGRFDVLALVRWFTIIGAVSTALGLALIASRFFQAENLIDGALAAGAAGSIALGLHLRGKRPATAAALQLAGGLLLQAFRVSFAAHHSIGSDNWPALVGIDALLLLVLAYALRNRLVLAHAVVNLFVWFGGSTGYVSGWGAYWLGMNYPLRFAVAGLAAVGIGWAHYRWLRGALQAFSRVWAHFGLLVFNFALWFFSVFGYFEKEPRWEEMAGERLAFSLLWALLAGGSLLAGARFGLQILRAYGLVFLIINAYTFYFQFVVANTGQLWFLHLLISGGSLVGLGVWLEARRKRTRVDAEETYGKAPEGSP